jgi:fermentation-respiration switch protein FrsA (DUF1100 family)
MRDPQVDAPKFFAFGGNDTNVPVQDSVKVLQANAIRGLIKVYADGGHAIRSNSTNTVQEEFLEDLVEFIGQS